MKVHLVYPPGPDEDHLRIDARPYVEPALRGYEALSLREYDLAHIPSVGDIVDLGENLDYRVDSVIYDLTDFPPVAIVILEEP